MQTSLALAMRRISKGWQLYVLILLPLVYLIVFRYVPMYGAQIAFKKFVLTKGIWESDWVGLRHFKRFWNTPGFWSILRNTLWLSLYQLIVSFPCPILLALGLNYVRGRTFKRTVQMVTYAPHFISVVVVAGITMQMLAPRTGAVNNVLALLGFERINFMGEPGYFMSIFVWSDVWQNIGFGCIVYLAALAGIDPTLHEAAMIDGASKRQRMLNIDLPGIMPVAMIILILNMGHILDLGFEKALLLQNPLNIGTSEIIDTYVYKIGLQSQVPNFDYAAAIGLFKNGIAFVLLLTANKLAKTFTRSSLW
ncbi:ABC transporter permease subunit [Paenibacillus aurantius]|uniref:ABC transporter permease subunit n=1 Tax=Paenibacillus aurantius TaxID=2918900 RepID=A0AA96RC70_9BACL|nr:ABC transporter permease subunit [Paenibacillus aurantius]WNQ10210.1 ABC transporter permease subunit [Paenibacillus aurantius]